MGSPVSPALTWLVRHGQSTSNAGLPADSFGGIALTELGVQQARALAAKVERQPDLLVVSPFLRTRATAEPILERWPSTRCETWPIQELTYLSPERCRGTTAADRKPWVDTYWRRCDPDYVDAPDAESFRAFATRLSDFHRRLVALDAAFVVVVGHGQFIRGYLLGRSVSFQATPDWMRAYRADETARPMANCEIVELSSEDWAGTN